MIHKFTYEADVGWCTSLQCGSSIALCRVVMTGIDQRPSDDWPFLYLRKPAIPRLNIRGTAIFAALSVTLLLALAPVRTLRPNGNLTLVALALYVLSAVLRARVAAAVPMPRCG